MRVESVAPEDISGELEATSFRVLLWYRPQSSGSSWALDEWNVFDTQDVTEVIRWAESQKAATYEVAVQWMDKGYDPDGKVSEFPRYKRIAGQRGGDEATTRTVTFTSNH